MMNTNWLLRNLILKKKMLKEIGVDIRPLDNEKKVNEAFLKAALVFPEKNGRGVA
jgi:hypothetical protein